MATPSGWSGSASAVWGAVSLAFGCGGVASPSSPSESSGGTLPPGSPAAASPSASAPAAGAGLVTRGPVILHTECFAEPVETCLNARDDNCDGRVDEACGLPPSSLWFALAWSGPSDLDLEVIDPQGELAKVGWELQSGLVKARDCPGESCPQPNLEYVYLPLGQPETHGRYRIRVAERGDPRLFGPPTATLAVVAGRHDWQLSVRLGASQPTAELELSL